MAKKKTAKKNGRPSKYKPEYEEQAYKLCLLGSTDEEMGDFFGVSKVTINAWKKNKKGFLNSIKRGKQNADANVAESLYKRACGYKHPEDKIFCTNGEVTTVRTTKHYPPDTAACFIWLKNRAGWRDKQDVEHGITGELKEFIEQLDGKISKPPSEDKDD